MKKNTNNSNNKNVSARRKLIPAVAMLATSAAMLSTSTYAWFTMSKEVEVKNIQLTATTTADIQISLGHLTSPTGGYSDNTGTLTTNSSGGTSADNGNVLEPTSTEMHDWSNSVDISNYYLLGKLIPASSYNGASVFFTPNANGVGQTLSDGAKFYTAASGLAAKSEDNNVHGSDAGNNSLKTTLHAKTSSGDSWSASAAVAWNNTNDDGYYVDIPVWLRTSNQSAQNVTVKAFVIPKGATSSGAASDTDRDLYKAIRVAVLNDSGNTSNLLSVRDGLDQDTHMVLADPYASTNTVFTNGYYNRAGTPSLGKDAVSEVSSEGTNIPTYEDVLMYTDTVKVAQLKAPASGKSYGDATKLYIRVWLEGEDKDCWNANAGQDFSINLRFEKGGTDT
ncbi:MAG: hypothetical protein Q4D76_00790 [Oscillospiraceae bacterium]|nr:hypothetical protein [Oscillospiraceae bacterium]